VILWHYAWLLVWPHLLLLDRSWAQTNAGMTAGWIAAFAWVAVAAGVCVTAHPWSLLRWPGSPQRS